MAKQKAPEGARTEQARTEYDQAMDGLSDAVAELQGHVRRVLRDVLQDGSGFRLPILNGLSVQKALDGGLRFDLLGDMAETVAGLGEGWRRPFLDLSLDGDTRRLVLHAELPGIRREEVGLEVLPEGIYLRAEGRRRRYQASVRPGLLIDPDGAKASLEDGILTATFPVARVETQRRRIPIRGKSQVRKDDEARRVPVD